MTLEWSNYKEKSFFLLYNLPDSLKGALSKAWHQQYEELYESDAEGVTSLQDALDEILELFQGNNQTLSHLRYVWMALILACVVEPTVKYYQPNTLIPEETINQIAVWLVKTLQEMVSSKMPFAQVAREKEKEATAIVDVVRLFTENQKIVSFQVLFEALDVYSSAIKTLDYNQSLEALLDILDDCLEGYAIFPGSYGRRELFDWWLLEVVPASWYLLPPSSIYLINELPNDKNIALRQMNKLQEISFAMWSTILRINESQNSSSLRSFRSIFDSSTNEIE
ncbi:MAG: hypothetical protein WBV73_16880, partial [Phormidium sp.]